MRLPLSAETTIEIILFCDALFDSFNGKEGKEYSSIITPSSKHIVFWETAVNKLRKMDFVESVTHKRIRRNTKCLERWIWIIQSAQLLWNTLHKSGFSSLNLRFINQDPVENCFSQIRDHGHRNNNPLPYQFCASFKTLITTNFTSKHSISSNCKEEYEGKSLSLAEVLKTAENIDVSEEHNEETDCAESSIPSPKLSSVFVAVKNIIHIVTNKIANTCTECVQSLENEDTLRTIRHALDIAELKFINICHELQIKQKLKSILYLEAFSTLSTHCVIQLEYLIDETAKQFIIEWCKFVNKILTGTLQDDDYTQNYMYNEIKRMSLKFKKEKLKTKKTNIEQ